MRKALLVVLLFLAALALIGQVATNPAVPIYDWSTKQYTFPALGPALKINQSTISKWGQLDAVIPAPIPGPQGPQGIQGPPGVQGATGPAGAPGWQPGSGDLDLGNYVLRAGGVVITGSAAAGIGFIAGCPADTVIQGKTYDAVLCLDTDSLLKKRKKTGELVTIEMTPQ